MGVGPNRLNALTVARATTGLAAYLRDACDHQPLVAIAYDTRIHSRDFALTAARVLAAAGCRAAVFDQPAPTPTLSFAVRELGADAGIVLTASHNPKEYNGYKVYGSSGDQATDVLAHAVAARIAQVDPFAVPEVDLDSAVADGRVAWAGDDLLDAYASAVCAQSTVVDISDVRVAYSPLNGTGLVPVRMVAERLGIDLAVVREQAAPDGTFPTCPKPNPEHAEAMRAVCDLALAEGRDLAIANDPDADRIGVAVRHGGEMRLLTGDEVGLLLLDFLCKATELPERPVAVSTVVSTLLLDAVAEAHGVELRRTLTGFKYVGEQMNLLEGQDRGEDFLVGIEESCGYLRGTYVRDKDGVVALMLASELAAWHKAQGRDLVDALDALHVTYGHMTSRQVSVERAGATGREEISATMAALREDPPAEVAGLAVERVTDYAVGAPMPGDPSQTLPPANVLQLDLAGGSRLIVRPSGTEPKVKSYCFAAGGTAGEAADTLDSMCAAARTLLGKEGQ